MKLSITFVVFSFFFGLLPATAATMQIMAIPRSQADKAIEGPVKVVLSGEIDIDAPKRLRTVLSKVEKTWISVYIDSPGGNLLAGMEIGRILREIGATTTVGIPNPKSYTVAPGRCLSACSLSFLGGDYRYLAQGSIYGVHRVSISRPSSNDLDKGQIIAAAMGAYIREMGVDSRLLSLSVKAGSNGMYILTKSELEQLQVVNNGRKAPLWSIEVVEGGTFLKGAQETLYGTGKMSISCSASGGVMFSSYTAGDKAPVIANGDWEHSAFINNESISLPPPVKLEARDDTIYAMFVIPPASLRMMRHAETVGHAMQISRDAPTFVGYKIDIDKASRSRFDTYIGNCFR